MKGSAAAAPPSSAAEQLQLRAGAKTRYVRARAEVCG